MWAKNIRKKFQKLIVDKEYGYVETIGRHLYLDIDQGVNYILIDIFDFLERLIIQF